MNGSDHDTISISTSKLTHLLSARDEISSILDREDLTEYEYQYIWNAYATICTIIRKVESEK